MYDVNTHKLSLVQIPIPKCFESDNPAFTVKDGQVVALVCDDTFHLKVLTITKEGEETYCVDVLEDTFNEERA